MNLKGEEENGVKKELEELKELVPEIQLKIEDCEGSAEAEVAKRFFVFRLTCQNFKVVSKCFVYGVYGVYF